LTAVFSMGDRAAVTHYERSLGNPSFVLADGTGSALQPRLARAVETANWINRQDFGYELVGANSNAVAHTLARAMGFDVTGQPIDRATGRHLPAPGGTIDLTRLKPGAPPPIADPVRVNGYGAENRPASPARDASRASGLDPAGLIFGRDAAERVRARHGFDPRAGVTTSEQKESIRAWLADAVAPKLAAHALPAALGGDLLVRAARTSPTAAARVLQEGLNRFGAPSVSVDGWVGPETLGALERRLDAHGADVVRGAVALGGLNRDLDAMAKGELRAETAPSVFRDGIGRLFGAGARVERSPAADPVFGPAHYFERGGEVRGTQRALNETAGIFQHLEAPLKVDGDFGPKTGAALVATTRAAGAERLTDHLGKRLGLGEPGLAADPARGFEPALAVPDRQDRERWGGLV
jgi:hypothetical protein